MVDAVLRIESLPESPLDASAYFHASVLPEIRAAFRQRGDVDVLIVFDCAGHEHRSWRLAAIQELAREAAPARINGVASDDDAAIAAARAWLAGAKGVTGQLLALDSHGAGPVL